MSPVKDLEIELEVARHSSTLSRMLSSEEVDQNDLENANETHVDINMDNGRTMGFYRDKEVKYADFFSGRKGM